MQQWWYLDENMDPGPFLWLKRFNESKNRKVLLMLSGGKDSILCAVILDELGIDMQAIHFTHDWSWEIPTGMARDICKERAIPLTRMDITPDLENELFDKVRGRPCATCKSIMVRKAMEYAMENDFGWICIGEILVDPVFSKLAKRAGINATPSTFFMNTFLPSMSESGQPTLTGDQGKIKVLRPLIHMKPTDVLNELEARNIHVKQVGEAGDSWIEYTREGCPLHYNNKWPWCRSIANKLVQVNKLVTRLARKHGCRAAFSIADCEVITIPPNQQLKAEIENEIKHLLD